MDAAPLRDNILAVSSIRTSRQLYCSIRNLDLAPRYGQTQIKSLL